ncbi:hypothetical protein JVU11DRAFT_10285 [Chiua virens]|nr:hypothetical protein JVU11DRAFT_10285 [Chiua virens]
MTALELSSGYSSAVDLFQNSFYIGISLENILYGIELFLYFKTMWILLTSRSARDTSNAFYAMFSSVMLFLVTIWVASQALFGEKMWILDVSYPGGPEKYYKKYISAWYMDCGTTAVILLQLMTDGLMIHRCLIIWDSYRIIVIPSILWLGCLGLGILVDWTTSSRGGDFFSGFGAQLGFAYYTVAVVLNTTLTCLICYRILRQGKIVQKQLGHEYASLYFSVVTLFVESVFPYTVSGIAFLVSLGMGSSTSVAFISVYFLMMCVSPQMLILRVIMGRAMDDQMIRQPSSIKFSSGADTGTITQTFGTIEANVHLQTLSNVYLEDSKV